MNIHHQHAININTGKMSFASGINGESTEAGISGNEAAPEDGINDGFQSSQDSMVGRPSELTNIKIPTRLQYHFDQVRISGKPVEGQSEALTDRQEQSAAHFEILHRINDYSGWDDMEGVDLACEQSNFLELAPEFLKGLPESAFPLRDARAEISRKEQGTSTATVVTLEGTNKSGNRAYQQFFYQKGPLQSKAHKIDAEIRDDRLLFSGTSLQTDGSTIFSIEEPWHS